MRINGDGTTHSVTGDKTNGNWFVVLGSGPTGPVSTSDHQFLGRSDQPLTLFVLNLRDGSLVRTISTTADGSTIANAFSGSLMNAPLDVDQDYQDEAMYVPYVKKDDAAGTWTRGGVARLRTMKDPNPAKWDFRIVADGLVATKQGGTLPRVR